MLSDIVASQVEFHRKFGGVVPEIASRRHLEVVNVLVEQALRDAGTGLSDVDALAVTVGPGLVGALLVGVAAAKTIAYVTRLPLVGVNHLEGHIYANFLEHADISPPFVCLVVSGGHTSLVLVRGHGDYRLLGQTLDDAAGEAFDKIAGFLGLGYPGGPIIDELAKRGDPEAVPFPRAMIDSGDFNFSLSGLKTAVLNYVARAEKEGKTVAVADLVASFQAAVVDVLVTKTARAALAERVEVIAMAGGVAANSALRRRMEEEAARAGLALFVPRPSLCTDNAAMIACAGYYRYLAGDRVGLDVTPDPNLPLA